jgi:hypothetical protein
MCRLQSQPLRSSAGTCADARADRRGSINGLAYLGTEPAGILKLTLLLPFVWLLLESKQKLVLGR